MAIVFDGIKFDEGFRADLIVENKVIVDLKSVENVIPVHKKQLLTYLRLADKKLGLLINGLLPKWFFTLFMSLPYFANE